MAIALLVLAARGMAAPHDDLMPPHDPPATRTERVQAKQHTTRAVKLYNQRKYDAALDELHKAADLDPSPELLYAIGQVHTKLGHCVDAITYYQRYLDSHPGQVPTLVTTRAIKDCEAKLPPPPPPPPKLAPAAPPKDPDPPAKQASVLAAGPRWYDDKLADGLVAGGVVSSVIGLLCYRAALGDLDHADTSTTLPDHAMHVDNAQTMRGYALVFGGLGVGLATAGVVRYELHRGRAKHEVAVVPTAGGAMISVSGSLP